MLYFCTKFNKRMKRFEIILLFLSLWSGLIAQNTVKNDSIVDKSRLIVLPDSLLESEEGDVFDLMNDTDLTPMDHILSVPDTAIKKRIVVDSIKGAEKSVTDTVITYRLNMVMPVLEETDSLLIDSVQVDSLVSRGILEDTLIMDSLVVDSTLMDVMAIDSTYEMRRKAYIADSLRADSIRIQLEKNKFDSKRNRSIAKFQRLLASFRRDYHAALLRWDDTFLTMDNVRMKPEYYKYVVPLTYYSSSIVQAGTIEGWEPEDILSKQVKEREAKRNANVPNLCVSKPMIEEVERQMLSFYINYPELVLRNESEFAGLAVLSNKDLEAGPRNENILNMMQPMNKVESVTESDLVVYRPNYWTTGGIGYLQFSQNHISDNWYKGGESTKSLLSGLVLFANFNDKQKVQFENKLEWKLGFITAPSDTLHSYKANNDMIRLNSKFGLRAIKNWYYTLSVDFKTQLFSNYKTNTDDLISALFSPAELNVGLGMDFKYVKGGTCNLSVLINPINYTLYTVMSDEVDPTKFNIKEGHKHENVFGSRFEATLKWKLFKSLMWESNLSYTTNYEKALADWENTFTFVVNKYLSTKLFVHGRFDDGAVRKEGQSYFQLQEILSFGLNYTW